MMNSYYMTQIPPEVCDVASDEFDIYPQESGTVTEERNLSYDKRHCLVSFVELHHWFTGVLHHAGILANEKMGWDLAVNDRQKPQVANYAKGHHFDWHIDVSPFTGSPQDRKITVVCLLNNPEEFAGGDFELKFEEEKKIDLKKGSVIAFPAFIPHRVTPVQQGLRRTATLWLTGPKFR